MHDNGSIPCRMVFFDAGMTLIQPVPEFRDGIQHVLHENGFEVKREDLEKHSADAVQYLISEIHSGRRYAVSDEADEEFWGDVYERLVSRLDYSGDARALGLKIYYFYRQFHSFDLFPNSLPTLQILKERGFRLGVISNFSTMLQGVFELRGLRGFFDPFIVSAEVNMQKPDPEIYALAMERAGVAPDDCVMVGDNPVDDVRGAAAAGVRGVLIDRFNRNPAAPAPRITTLAQLPGLLSLRH
jgi:putative hydrolase of the HAD superfamily